VALAAWLEMTAELGGTEAAAPLIAPATQFARLYLRTATK
jgi:hypothetical protein